MYDVIYQHFSFLKFFVHLILNINNSTMEITTIVTTNFPFLRFMINIIIIIFFFSTLPSSSSAQVDILTAGQSLADGQTLISENGSFALGFFGPENSNDRYVGIWYNKVSVRTVVWVANRKAPVSDGHGSLSINSNGNLLITNKNSTVVWSSTSAAPRPNNPVAQLLDNGNFVLKEADSNDNVDPNSFSWQSFDQPTDTLLPGMKLGLNLTSGLIRNLTAWTSASDPAPSEYTMAMDIHGYPQVFLWSGSRREWRGGPWNGLRFTGIPEMISYKTMFSFDFVANREEVSYSFYITEPSVISRLIVNQSGITQRLVWIEESKVWNPFWFAPKDQCDYISPCGQYGICDPNTWPICSCAQGFQPKNPTNWALRDGSDGCVRKTALDCRNRTDGFLLVRGAKVPDTSNSWFDMSLTLEQCRSTCLSNCSCTAYASANISSGIGCIIWTVNLTDMRVYTNGGQDLYIRVAAADLGTESKHSKWSTIAAIFVGSVLGILVLLLIGFCVKKRKQRRRRRQHAGDLSRSVSSSLRRKRVDENSDSKNLDLPLYDLTTIIHATDDFATENKLGEGGFGPVFKGKLGDGQEIAVKRLAKTSVQGIDEFKNEVMLIAKLQHRNLVRLLGCCVQEDERMLIYEYMDNKSLDVFLFDKAKRRQLDWQTRYNIIIGIARGLLYLHQDSRFRIIHRDLKTSNILLDKDMRPKISDFGLARIFGGDETEVNTKRVVGTYGYMSPEYAMDGVFSIKSDVFSFGVLVLEIITGKKNRGVYVHERHENLLGHAWSLWKEGHGMELADTSLGDAYPMTEVLRCLKVGLLCVQERPDDRPTMSAVVFMLGSESSYVPQPKPPGFIATKGPFESDSSSSKQTSYPLNEVSLTMFEGR